MLTAEELRQIRRLHVQAGRRVDALLAGEYRSAFKGAGMEFDEVRPYVPGDDVRRIDWNVTARTGEAWLKLFREEREQTLLLVADVSGSVRFGGGGRDGRTDKRLQIARAAGGLAYAALRSNDRVGMVAFSDSVEQFLPPRRSRGHAWQVIRTAFEHRAQSHRTDLAGALSFASRVLKRRATVVVLSDFLSPVAFDGELGALARRHRVHALVIHDPLEQRLPGVGLLTITDAETGATRVIDAGAARLGQLPAERRDRLRRRGVRTSLLGTHEDPFQVLHHHFRGDR